MVAFFNRLSPSLQAIFLACMGYSLFSLADAIAKSLRLTYSVNQVLGFSSGLALIMTVAYIYHYQGPNGFKTKKLKLHIFRGILLAISSHCVVHAFATVPLAEFYGIVFLSPFIVTILAFFFLKEKIKLYQMGAILSGLAGVMVLAGPKFSTMHEGFLYLICSTSLFSVNLLVIRKIGSSENKMLFPLFAFGGIVLSSWPFLIGDSFLVPVSDTAIFFIYAVILLIAQICLARGYAIAPQTAVVAPFHYIQMLWGILLGYFLFKDVPSITTLTGAVLIIGSGLYMLLRERRPKAAILAEDTQPL